MVTTTSDFSTDDILFTEVFELLETDNVRDFYHESYPYASVGDAELFTEIPLVEDIILLVVVVAVGLILNGIILRCYWSVKTVIGIYCKWLAVFDILTLIYLVVRWSTLHFMASNVSLNFTIRSGSNLIACIIIIGPLFLALDRGLMVAFPHKFKLYKTRMRIFKAVWLVLSMLGGVANSFLLGACTICFVLATVNYFLQILVCVGLYAFIAVRIMISERKLKNHRQIGKKYI